MSNRDFERVERALEDLADERKSDLRELESSGPPTDIPDLRAAFLDQMGEGRRAGTPNPHEPVCAEPVANPWREAPAWRLVVPRLAAAALLLVIGGVVWVRWSDRQTEPVQVASGETPVDPNDPGPAMSESPSGGERIQVESWDGAELTLRLDRDEVRVGFRLDVTIRTDGKKLARQKEVTSIVQSFDLGTVIQKGQSVDVTVRLFEDGADGP